MRNERKITTIGKPNLEKMTKTEQKSFYGTLLALITDYYAKERPPDNGAHDTENIKNHNSAQ